MHAYARLNFTLNGLKKKHTNKYTILQLVLVLTFKKTCFQTPKINFTSCNIFRFFVLAKKMSIIKHL